MAEVPNVPAGATFTVGEKEYFLPRVTQKVMDDYEAYSASRALDRVRVMSQFQTADENVAAHREMVRQIKVGSLGWDTEDSYLTRRTPDGLTRVCWIAMRTNDPSVTLAEVQAVAKKCGTDFLYEKWLLANADPTEPPPPNSAAGGSSAPGSPNAAASANKTSTA